MSIRIRPLKAHSRNCEEGQDWRAFMRGPQNITSAALIPANSFAIPSAKKV